jgi:signal transduction histidine kinase
MQEEYTASLYNKNYVDSLNKIAFVLRNSDILQAKQYLTTSIQIAEKLGYTRGLAEGLGCMGLLDLRLGEYDMAIKHHFKSLKLAEQLADSQMIAFRYNDIANVYNAESYFEQSLQYYIKSLEIKRKIKDAIGIATTYNNIAGIYIKQKRFSTALWYVKKTQNILAKTEDKRVLARNYRYYAEIFTEKGEYDSALHYHQKAITIQKTIKDELDQIISIADIGYIYAKQKNIEVAIQHYLIALAKAQKYRIKQPIALIYQRLAEAYSNKKDFKTAYQYEQNLLALNDSLFHQKYDDKISLLEIKREADKREAQILTFKHEAQLQKERQKQQNIWLLFASFAITVLLLIAGLILYNNRQKTKTLLLLSTKKEEIEKQKQKIQRQNEVLVAQNEKLYDLNVEKDGLISVVAHDLRSPLNRIKGLVQLTRMEGKLLKEQDEYLQITEKVCQNGIELIKDLLLINNIENENSSVNSKIINFYELMQDVMDSYKGQAQQKNIQIVYKNPIKINNFSTDEGFLRRILDNLLSNAIKFSMPNTTILLIVYAEDASVKISVKDEGLGMSEIDKTKLFKKFQKLSAKPTAGEDSTGLGLSIVKALVEKLQGTITVDSKLQEGTEFTVILPFLQ